MKNIIFTAKILLGAGIIIFAANSLCFFENAAGLAAGTAMMLAGVICALLLQRRSTPLFVAAALVCAAGVFVNFGAQYFFGGFMIYFACRLWVAETNKISHKLLELVEKVW